MNWIEAFHRRHSARRDVTGGKLFPALMLALLVAGNWAGRLAISTAGRTRSSVNWTISADGKKIHRWQIATAMPPAVK
jgi:hypothetical protein